MDFVPIICVDLFLVVTQKKMLKSVKVTKGTANIKLALFWGHRIHLHVKKDAEKCDIFCSNSASLYGRQKRCL